MAPLAFSAFHTRLASTFDSLQTATSILAFSATLGTVGFTWACGRLCTQELHIAPLFPHVNLWSDMELHRGVGVGGLVISHREGKSLFLSSFMATVRSVDIWVSPGIDIYLLY